MGRSGDEAKYFAHYLDLLANAKAHAENHPSVPREVWLLSLRARDLIVANMPVALFDEYWLPVNIQYLTTYTTHLVLTDLAYCKVCT